MKAFLWSFLLLLPAMAAAGESGGEAVEAAQAAVEAWLAMTDQGQFESSWDAAAPYFQAAVAKSDWQRQLGAVRSPLGAVHSREVASHEYRTSLPGAPDGEYVVFQFNTAFEHKAAAVETVTAMRGAAGDWRVAGYFIK